MKVYIVETGDKWEEHIHSVWSTEEKAKEMVSVLSGKGERSGWNDYELDKEEK